MTNIFCNYDSKLNRVAILIKKNGVYDTPEIESGFLHYFEAVKKHLSIENVGIQKFSGGTKSELDAFISDVTTSQSIGYLILVGDDLPITTFVEPGDNPSAPLGGIRIDFDTIQYAFSKVLDKNAINDDTRVSNPCTEVAISVVVPPFSYNLLGQQNFIMDSFANFTKYHLNYEQTISSFDKRILMVQDLATNATTLEIYQLPSRLRPELMTAYETVYFYDVIYAENIEHEKIRAAYQKKPLILMFDFHGNPYAWGFGLFDSFPNSNPPRDALQSSKEQITYVSEEDLIRLADQNDAYPLFVDSFGACDQDFVHIVPPVVINPKPTDTQPFCCWPQAMLKIGAWTFVTVNGSPYHTSLERLWFDEKILGNALRKTYHSQEMVYGDILATLPSS